ncbi:hypothetical protein H072_3321 [Dactylellina haptotyla CBS 200.50]|uniref:Uncharacterized protein n=1 Tax=Dactylellina haptotyla (strain CBS 200.50) TaxID=1284197 RepID=S8BT92_DACHA|nr:hypothetical protein H072_3321 [Dactylellina haptotyla CBS 200.50]
MTNATNTLPSTTPTTSPRPLPSRPGSDVPTALAHFFIITSGTHTYGPTDSLRRFTTSPIPPRLPTADVIDLHTTPLCPLPTTARVLETCPSCAPLHTHPAPFEKSLYDLIRGLRAHKGNEKAYIAQSMQECRNEAKSNDMGTLPPPTFYPA